MAMHIEAMQTVIPMKPTDTKVSRQVNLYNSESQGICQWWFHFVQYYKKASEEDSGWSVAGWMKESLGAALSEAPLIAGRLRRGAVDGAGLHILSNDSGVRLLEAQMLMDMSVFLDSKESQRSEAQLVYWEDIDEQNPEFSPLLYVQVTNFKCGGYSIGISSSVLLADILFKTCFMKRWAEIHINIVTKAADTSRRPMFYFPRLRTAAYSPAIQNGLDKTRNGSRSVIFKIALENSNSDNDMHKTIAKMCIEEAENKFGTKMPSKYSLFIKENLPENIKVESCLKHGAVEKLSKAKNQLIHSSWDDFGAQKISFSKGNMPAQVSYWISSAFGEGLVMVIPSSSEAEGASDSTIIVTVPNEHET